MKSSKEAGFTLIELLLVLTVVLILSGLVIPSMVKAIHKMEIKQFLRELESDVLYAQSHSFGESDYIRIHFEQTHYRITNTQAKTKKIREYPVDLRHSKVHVVRFGRSGTLKGGKSFILSNDRTMYRIVFPLGKGRHYVEEQ